MGESSERTASYAPNIALPPVGQKPGSFLSAFCRSSDRTVSLDHSQGSENVPRWVWVSESPGCGNRALPSSPGHGPGLSHPALCPYCARRRQVAAEITSGPAWNMNCDGRVRSRPLNRQCPPAGVVEIHCPHQGLGTGSGAARGPSILDICCQQHSKAS